MRRVTSAVTASALATTGVRTIYTQFHATIHDFSKGLTPSQVLSKEEDYYYVNFTQVPLIIKEDAIHGGAFIDTFSGPEHFLYSAIINDNARLGKVDWTYGFDAFWVDRVESHARSFEALYGDKPGFRKYILGNYSKNVEGKREVEKALNSLQSMLKWALETEKAFTAIFNARFNMQREVFDALERERLLGGVLELTEEFHRRIPSEYKRKATIDLDWHMHNVKMWTADIPNVKRSFPRSV